ncbi:MAG: hypothetical protein ACRD1R_04980 [Acidobacteriota bacterium]
MHLRIIALLTVGIFLTNPFSQAQSADSGDAAPIHVWVAREYNSWDNPLHSEFIINGSTINIYTSDSFEPIEEYLKEGWNTITIKTTPQEPASKGNTLIFRIGSMRKDNNRMIMNPVLWEFENGTDWKFDEGTYSHPLGPNVKEVTLTYNFYFAGLGMENQELKAGDFILVSKPNYGGASVAWNPSATATVFVNGTPLNSFALQSRQVVITSLLKKGKNEIKLVSHRVPNAIRDNDIEFSIAGPAEWNVQEGKYVVQPVVQFETMQGWQMDSKSGMLINPAQPDSETIERVIPVFLKDFPE